MIVVTAVIVGMVDTGVMTVTAVNIAAELPLNSVDNCEHLR